jgi:hypothetical protein
LRKVCRSHDSEPRLPRLDLSRPLRTVHVVVNFRYYCYNQHLPCIGSLEQLWLSCQAELDFRQSLPRTHPPLLQTLIPSSLPPLLTIQNSKSRSSRPRNYLDIPGLFGETSSWTWAGLGSGLDCLFNLACNDVRPLPGLDRRFLGCCL